MKMKVNERMKLCFTSTSFWLPRVNQSFESPWMMYHHRKEMHTLRWIYAHLYLHVHYVLSTSKKDRSTMRVMMMNKNRKKKKDKKKVNCGNDILCMSFISIAWLHCISLSREKKREKDTEKDEETFREERWGRKRSTYQLESKRHGFSLLFVLIQKYADSSCW